MDNEYNNGSTAVSAVTLVVDFSEMQESINSLKMLIKLYEFKTFHECLNDH